MRSLLLLLALWTSSSIAQKVVTWDVGKRAVQENASRKSRRATISEALGNAEELYYANVTIGTPGQLLQLQLDTGSSDVWMTESNATFCKQEEDACIGGTFDPTQSSTYKLVQQGAFQVQYVDNSGSEGDYFSDNINIGGVTVTGQQMGLAKRTTIGTGIVGVGFAQDESVCAQSEGPCQTYPSIIDSMVNQSKINSHAYSLWLNDVEANTGSIIFGGVDTDKYEGQLVTLPILPDAQSGGFTSFTVAWTGFNIGTPKGVENTFVPQNFAQPAILDSGTSTLLFPDDVAQQLFDQFGAQYSNQLQAYVAPCYLQNANATLNFQFGGTNGPTISVAVSEFLLDLTGPGQPPLKFDNGDVACLLGFEGAQGRPILLGDTFLRSAYVVYDLDNRQVSIAPTRFDATSSNVQEIRAGSNGVPNVASTASAASISATATGVQTLGIEATGSPDALGNGGAASSLSPSGLPPLAQFTTAPASASSTSGSQSGAQQGSPQKGAAAGLMVPLRSSEGLFLMVLLSVLTTLGSSFVWL